MQARSFGNWAWRVVAVVATLLAVILALRVLQSERQPDLKPWHTWAPRDADAGDIGELDWPGWMAREDALMKEVRTYMAGELEPADRVAANRYFDGSPLNSAHFAPDWNRSYEMLPLGEPRGAVVLLHGLSDSPYSLRHVATAYLDQGYAAIGLRLPGHGTVPAGLTRARWQDWRAATRLALREARRMAGPGKPLHVVGYSNGGALALQYTLDSIEGEGLDVPTRVVLISPMLGLTRFARYAGIAGWPAMLPRFSKTAWLDLVPEFNPFKYNSFPVNAARQSYELTQQIDAGLRRAVESGAIRKMPPVLAFQSVVDSTVAGEAVVGTLFARLPENGSELVLFDVNRATPFDLLLSPSAQQRLAQMLPAGAQRYRITVIGNAPGDEAVSEISRLPGSSEMTPRPLEWRYPTSFFSLSHVALPFPPSDSLYGTEPDDEDYGVHLGSQAPRAERGTLINGADSLVRASCNPFFGYLKQRIEEGL
jgi:alpha-beta hydrolase superfamily lysophospholipase